MTLVRQEDRYVGSRIRLRRHTQGLTQTALAEKIGVKFQQLQKYETGKNRVSASRLVDIATALGVQPEFFFRGLSGNATPDDVTSRAEVLLLESYRAASPNAQTSILRIAQEAAQVSA